MENKTKKGIILLTDFFEDTEAICTIDILKRSGIDIDIVSLKEEKEVVSQYNLKVICDKTFEDVEVKKYDFLLIPGGRAVLNDLVNREEVKDIIHHFAKGGKLVATICAAPLLLGELGYLVEKNYTCFPGCEATILGGKKKDSGVVVDGNFITAKSMAYSVEFALTIVEYLLGKEKRKEIKKQIFGEE